MIDVRLLKEVVQGVVIETLSSRMINPHCEVNWEDLRDSIGDLQYIDQDDLPMEIGSVLNKEYQLYLVRIPGNYQIRWKARPKPVFVIEDPVFHIVSNHTMGSEYRWSSDVRAFTQRLMDDSDENLAHISAIDHIESEPQSIEDILEKIRTKLDVGHNFIKVWYYGDNNPRALDEMRSIVGAPSSASEAQIFELFEQYLHEEEVLTPVELLKMNLDHFTDREFLCVWNDGFAGVPTGRVKIECHGLPFFTNKYGFDVDNIHNIGRLPLGGSVQIQGLGEVMSVVRVH